MARKLETEPGGSQEHLLLLARHITATDLLNWDAAPSESSQICIPNSRAP